MQDPLVSGPWSPLNFQPFVHLKCHSGLTKSFKRNLTNLDVDLIPNSTNVKSFVLGELCSFVQNQCDLKLEVELANIRVVNSAPVHFADDLFFLA